jgi:D-3-phosphoglycerate dehydrogenase
MYKVKTLNAISLIGLDQLPRDKYNIDPDEMNPDAIILRSQDMHNMQIPSSVKIIGRAGAGTNNIPVAELTKRGIPVLNTPGANANAVCEMVMAGLLLASRNICPAWEYVKQLQGDDNEIAKQVEQNKKQFAGFEIIGKTLGVIGLGGVGSKVANTAIALGMKVIGYDPTITVNRAWELSSTVQKANTIDEILQKSDFVTIHVPLTADTKDMIGHSRLSLAKKGIVLLNFSREGIVNEDDLLAALDNKQVRAYVTDFPCVKLKNHPASICLPHLGASTAEAEENCAVMIVKEVREYLEYGAITNSVNFPNVEVPADFKGVRIAITNANVPNMVAQISEKVGNAKRNIISLVNKSRDDVAYTVIDIDADVDSVILTAIAKINGVLQVRKLLPLK